MLVVTKNRTKRGRVAKAAVQSAFFGELYSLVKGFGPFLRGFGQALEKGRVLFLVTTSILPSLQVSTGICGVACPPPPPPPHKPLVSSTTIYQHTLNNEVLIPPVASF